MTRTPIICGSTFVVTGTAGDAYVESLPDDEPFLDEVLPILQSIVPPDAVVVDVGANVGLYTLGLARLAPTGHIHAFEPNPGVVKHLHENLRVNGLTNVVVHEVAVGTATGTMRFKENPSFTASSVTADRDVPLFDEIFAAGAIDVPSVTLDDAVREVELDRLDILKIDTEGHEIDVLDGARETLGRLRPLVVLEFNTYALTMHGAMLPVDALERIGSIFDRIFVTSAGQFREIRDPADALDLLYENATAAPVQDLICVFDDSRLTPDIEALAAAGTPHASEVDWLREQLENHREAIDWLHERLDAHEVALDAERRRADAAEADLEALRATLSWRLTGPLRSIRRRMSP